MFRAKIDRKRIFWSQDHNQDELVVQQAATKAAQENIDLTQDLLREDFLRQYWKARTLLMAQSEPLKAEYEPVQEDQYPTPNGTIAAWLMKNQTKSMASEQMRFMDFQAPIEMEALIMPSALM